MDSTYVVIHWPTEEQTRQRLNKCKANCGNRACNCRAKNNNAQCTRQCQCKRQCLSDFKPKKTKDFWINVENQLTTGCPL